MVHVRDFIPTFVITCNYLVKCIKTFSVNVTTSSGSQVPYWPVPCPEARYFSNLIYELRIIQGLKFKVGGMKSKFLGVPWGSMEFLVVPCTVELGFKNRQDKNLLDFKNRITNYQLVIYVVNYSQDKNILDFKNQNGSDRKSS